MNKLLVAILVTAAMAGAAAEPAPAAPKRDVSYYTTNYDGADVSMKCVQPAVPAVSKTNEAIAAVQSSVAAWFTCYEKFLDNLEASLPATKNIPADIARTMSPAQMTTAETHMNAVYAKLAADAKHTANVVASDEANWKKATAAAVAEMNAAHAARKLERENQQAGVRSTNAVDSLRPRKEVQTPTGSYR